MGFVTLIKTAEETPSGDTIITSVIEKEYLNVEELLDILLRESYVFVIHGKSHGIEPLEVRYTSINAVYQNLLDSRHIFKRPIGEVNNFFDMAGNTLAKFTYKCGCDDLFDTTQGKDLDLRTKEDLRMEEEG